MTGKIILTSRYMEQLAKTAKGPWQQPLNFGVFLTFNMPVGLCRQQNEYGLKQLAYFALL